MKHQIASVIGSLILAVLLVIGIQRGVISMTDVSTWLTPAILGGIIALLLWGFKDNIEQFFKGKPEPQKVEVVNLPQLTTSSAALTKVAKETEQNTTLLLDVKPLAHVKGTGADVPPSQIILGYHGFHIDKPKTEYLAKFGVMQVKAIAS